MTKHEIITIKKWLLAGITLTWSNIDEPAEISLSYGETLSGGNAFKIFFNGKFVSITKGFAPTLKKLEALKNEHEMHVFDYFNMPELIPDEVGAILWPLEDSADYQKLNEALTKLEPLGWTFEYGLDGCAYNLTKIEPQA